MGKHKEIVGFFPGVWDLLHPGHILALKEAKQYCDYLIVGLKENPKKDQAEKNKPIMSVRERTMMLLANKYVDCVLPYKTERELHLMDELCAVTGVRFMGADHKGKKHHPIKARVVYISRNHKYSSSALREKIKNA